MNAIIRATITLRVPVAALTAGSVAARTARH